MQFTVHISRKVAAVIGFCVLAVALCTVAACSHNNAQVAEGKAQATDSANAENNQPIPNVKWSQERENLIQIELAEVGDVQTTSWVTHQGDADPIYSCPSIGFGIPDTAQLSNPLQPYQGPDTTDGSDVVGQMDPNLIYQPTGDQGTFVICLTSTGQPYINRFEDNVDTVGGAGVWNDTTHSGQLVGAPTASATIGK
jgi:hypothetical protein